MVFRKKTMKRILILLVVLIAGIIAFFMYENRSFETYISKPHSSDMNIPINSEAPVKSEYMLEIDAPVDTVWQILTDIENWPAWQKSVTKATIAGKVEEGARFDWKAGGLSFKSRIHTMKPMTMLGWTGTTFGASAVHNWKFEDLNGRTKVSVEESLQGVFPRLFRKYFQANLDAGVKLNLEELKMAAEMNLR